MKILLYGINYFPELTGIGKYTGEMAAWLAAKGHSVRVVTAPPYYPEWKVGAGYSAWSWRVEHSAGVMVYRCPLWVPANPGGLRRIIHLATFACSSLPIMLRQIGWKPDVVWTVEPTLLCGPATQLVSALSGAKSWVHIQDYEVDAAFEMGLVPVVLRRVVSTIERWTMRGFDVVSTISGRMMERAYGKGVLPGKVALFPNWADISAIRPMATSPYRSELDIPSDSVVALYSGNMGGKQGLDTLAAVARQLQVEPSIRFVFCGEGSGKEDFVRRCAGLTNVHFLPLQPIERLSDLLALADVHLLPQRADAADLVMPSKLTGMLASGRVVVATAAAETELAQVIVKKAQCGLVVPPENPNALAQAICTLADNTELRARMGSNGRIYAERELDREFVLRRFEDDLLTCSAPR